MRRECQGDLRNGLPGQGHRIDGQDRVVPVVDAAEEDGLRARRGGRPLWLHAEGSDGDQRLQPRVVLERDRIQAPHRQHQADEYAANGGMIEPHGRRRRGGHDKSPGFLITDPAGGRSRGYPR